MPENYDATDYGVRIVRCDPAPGEVYWRLVKAHHLTGDENRGNHHLYLDVLNAAGQRVNGAKIQWNWVGSPNATTPAVIDKPPNEPGANIPIDSIRQVLWANVMQDGLDSDRVEGVTTNHPDEPPGNTLGHHSFLCVWQLTTAPIPDEPEPEPPEEPEPPTPPEPTTSTTLAVTGDLVLIWQGGKVVGASAILKSVG